MKKYIFLFASFIIIKFAMAQITNPAPYCIGDFDDSLGTDIPVAITNVSIPSFSNATTQCAFPHYIYYNNLTLPSVTQGMMCNISVSFNLIDYAGYGVWIDFNHNNIFDSIERILGGPAGSGSYNIQIPPDAMTGTTRMRVRVVQDANFTQGPNGYNILPCNVSTSATDVMNYGETEDYDINIISSSIGIKEIINDSYIKVYPNPTNNDLTIEFDAAETKSTIIEIKNVLGQTVKTITNTTFTKGNNKINLDVSELSGGIYLLILQDTNKSISKKFIKQ